jgi:hypothetical protein
MPYDIRFRGCYRDKVTQVASLAYDRTAFMAIPDAWLVHQPHQLSAAAAIAVGRTQSSERVQALQQVRLRKATHHIRGHRCRLGLAHC